MVRQIFTDSISPKTAAILALSVFLGAFAIGGGVRLLHEAAGRNLGANAVLWTGLLLLLGYSWRAVVRYRRIRREMPPDITERLARLTPPMVDAPPAIETAKDKGPLEGETDEAPAEDATEAPSEERPE